MHEPENMSDLQRRRVEALRPLTAQDCTDGIRKVGQTMRQRVLADYPDDGQPLKRQRRVLPGPVPGQEVETYTDEEPWGAWRA
ncbi:MAG: hypothetical protein ACRDQW_17500 [Haloechinothrix sp.]